MEKRSKKDLDDLKANWCGDPCWDIEDTGGFEAHHDELKIFRLQKEAEWREKEGKRIGERASKLGCSVALAYYIEGLEKRLAKLEDRADGL